MFNDKYGLTEAVLQGRKTMTRRMSTQLIGKENPDISVRGLQDGGKVYICLSEGDRPTTDIFPAYQPGEVVAVAQSYKDLKLSYIPHIDEPDFKTITKHAPQWGNPRGMKGWSNKMNVRADIMPHRIHITNVKVERLQDISEEDCLKEGIYIDESSPSCYQPFYTFVNSRTKDNCPIGYGSPQYAFAVLIDKISGKGTWERNPWVFAYTFELMKGGQE